MSVLSPAPRRRRARLLAGLAIAVAGSAAFAAPAFSDPVTDVALQTLTDGSSPFDAAAGPGMDVDAANGEVRSYDSVTFAWAVNVNSSTGASESFDRVVFTQTLPVGLSWTASGVPVYCQGAGWSISGRTLTCVYVPSGGSGTTGTTLNFTLTAMADGALDGTVATPAAGSTSVTVTAGATTSAPATATAPAVTIRSRPWLDMYKQPNPTASIAPAGDPRGPGYYLSYGIGLQVPSDRQSTYGRRGFLMPSAPVTFTDDLSQISPGAQFVSCSGGATCAASGASAVDVTFASLPADPTTTGAVASGSIRVFVPQADVDADADGNLNTTNTLTGLVAEAPLAGGGTIAAIGDLLPNNTVSYNLVTTGGSGNAGFNKRFLAADGSLLPTQTSANDGNGQVRDGQTLLSELRISNGSATAPVPAPAVCDVWDASRLQLAGSSAHGGAAVWAQTVPAGWTAGTDYVVEYGTQAAATGDDATRWTELRSRSACTDASDTWSTTLPADPSSVTKVRVRLLNDLPAAAGAVVFRVNLAVDDAADGDLIANFLGTRVGPTWSASNYIPSTNAGNQRGDRVRTNGITVRVRKRASNPSTPFGSPVAILSGNPVQFELTPTVTALDIGTGAPTASNVVVRDRLPLGLTFDPTRPTAPAAITPVVSSDASGRQILTWTIPSLTKGSEPTLTFWVRSATTAIGTRTNEAIVDSASDIDGLDDFPPSNTANQHYSTQAVMLQSPGGVRISKAALQSVVEPVDELGFRIEYANLTATTANAVDIIDVLPFAGDGTTVGAVPGRTPASARSGTLPVAAVEVAHGEIVRYTDAPPAAVYASSNPATVVDADYGALPAGRSWCLPAAFGTAGCPADLASVTAVRIARASLPSGDSAQITLRLAPTGNRSGNVYSNTAAIRYGSGNLGALSNVATSRVVASSIGDLVWEDRDRDGVQDAGEPGLADVTVTLAGTDKHGRAIAVRTTTDADGRYTFTSSTQAGQDAGVRDLVSGTYTVTFHRDGLPAGTAFTTQHAAGSTAADDSDADPVTGRADVVLPDPSPTGADQEDLDVDAGIVLGVPSPGSKPTSGPTPFDEPFGGEPGGGDGPTTSTDGSGNGSLGSDGSAPRRPRLTVVKRAAHRTVTAGDAIAWTIVVRNRGTAPARGTVVCDTPGDGLAVRRVPTGARFQDGRLCWRLGTVRAGGSRTVRVTTATSATLGRGHVTNVARATARGTAPSRTSARVSVRANGSLGAGGDRAGVTG
jgi:uncharacterized repeat protein (TIGR01451 family)